MDSCCKKCPICEKPFSKIQSLYGHLQSHGLKKKADGSEEKLALDCKKCNLKLPSLSDYWKHRRVHDGTNRPFTCPQCPELTFERQSQLHYHCERDHEKRRPHACNDCDKKFYKKSDLVTHAKLHKPEGSRKNHICDTCSRQFAHVSNLNRHKMTHRKEKPYVCQLCGQRYNQIATLNQHLKKHDHFYAPSAKNTRVFHCKFCGEKYEHLADLKLHQQEKHQSQPFPYSCKRCKKSFAKLASISHHQCSKQEETLQQLSTCFKDDQEKTMTEQALTTEKTEQKGTKYFKVSGNLSKVTYFCHIYNFVYFLSGYSLSGKFSVSRDSLGIIRGQDLTVRFLISEINEECTDQGQTEEEVVVVTDGSMIVGEIYESKTLKVSVELLASSEEKNNGHYLCSECKKCFARLDSFKQHFATHDQSFALACPECDAKFAWASTLRRHRQKLHNLPPVAADLKKLPCQLCPGATFKDKHHLKVHTERHHLKLKDHYCQICSKAFYAKDDLTNHLRIHTGEKPFKCSVCDKGFSHRSHRLRHERQIHEFSRQ